MKNARNSLPYSFILIGAGNLGSSVCRELVKKGLKPESIINRNLEKAVKLADEVGCENYSSAFSVSQSADFILIATNDDSISTVAKSLGKTSVPVFHTSGSTPLSVLGENISHRGVLYPLQSFTPGREISFDEVPVMLEASDKESLELLYSIGKLLSNRVYKVSSEDRLYIHLSAVFAANFTNHCIELAERLLIQRNLPDDILTPLIRETFEKVMEQGSAFSQTGPAARNDQKTLKKHQEILNNNQDLQKIYTFVSRSIIQLTELKKKSPENE